MLVVAIAVTTTLACWGEEEPTVIGDGVYEITLNAKNSYDDPYNDVDVDVVFTPRSGDAIRVPAFWDGGSIWKVRFAGSSPGEYTYEVSSNQANDSGLNGIRGVVNVSSIPSRLRVASDKRHFERNGEPFFWIGDTWWMGLCARMSMDGFRELADDRAAKGFNMVQIVMGPYPDMDAFDPRGANEAGHPFTEGFRAINPAYYEEADKKIDVLFEHDLTPCMVGMWGYYLPRLGVDNVKRYWRYIIARYGAYPVVWCAAGEGAMPYYLSKDKEGDRERQREGWTEVMRYIQETDPYDNLLSIHPVRYGRDQVLDPTVLDFEMLQTGHGDLETVPNVIAWVREACAREPIMPVVNSEVNYEGILGRSWQNIQRLDFYHSIMNGAVGFTYGANGIWQVNGDDKPYGPSPHGRSWGNTPWREAAQMPGSHQVGLGARLFQEVPWWKMERHTDWIAAPDDGKAYTPVVAGVPEMFRVVYIPMCWDAPKLLNLNPNLNYQAFYFDPVTGAEHELPDVTPNKQGEWQPSLPPEVHDWILVMNTPKD